MMSPQPRFPAPASSTTVRSWNYKVFESPETKYGLSDSPRKDSVSSHEAGLVRGLSKAPSDQHIIDEVMEAVYEYEKELKRKQEKRLSEGVKIKEEPQKEKKAKVTAALKRKASTDAQPKKKQPAKKHDVFSLPSDEGSPVKRKPLKQRNANEGNIIKKTSKPHITARNEVKKAPPQRPNTTKCTSLRSLADELKETTLTTESLAIHNSSSHHCHYWDKPHIKEWSLKICPC
eukprot:TRINITY_DN2266_c0_g1_i1.p1 TRINITY_DN2266_c0_g1~~TRINITY_DN2266_c0_g1_i1.p1  ORF type:complete len:232 (+),score=76.59 TRINITY_DN2266_c0_g1_i1:39-734(+)